MSRISRNAAAILLMAALLLLLSGCAGTAPEDEGSAPAEAPLEEQTEVRDGEGSEKSEEEEIMLTEAPEIPEHLAVPSGTRVEPGGDAGAFFVISPVTDAVYERILGKSFQEDGRILREDLRYLRTLYVDFEGKTRTGEILVNAKAAEDTLAVFRELYEQGYPIRRMVLVDAYYDIDHPKYDHLDRGNKADCVSIEDDNTSAFNYRTSSDNSSVLSNHAMGLAIDLNPYENPYVWADGTLDGPDGSAEYLDRSKASSENHMLQEGDVAVRTFKAHGFSWGGDWPGNKDYQHFDYEGGE